MLSNIRLVQRQVSRSHVSEGADPSRAPCGGQVGEGAAGQVALWPATTVTFYILWEVGGSRVLTECRGPRPSASSPLPYLFVHLPSHPLIHAPIHHHPPTHSPFHPSPHLPTLPQMHASSRIQPQPPHPCISATILSLALILQAPALCLLLHAALRTLQTEHLAHF